MQWNIIPRDFRNTTSVWVLECEGYTPHTDFVTFSFRGSFVRRKNNDVIPMERSRKWTWLPQSYPMSCKFEMFALRIAQVIQDYLSVVF